MLLLKAGKNGWKKRGRSVVCCYAAASNSNLKTGRLEPKTCQLWKCKLRKSVCKIILKIGLIQLFSSATQFWNQQNLTTGIYNKVALRIAFSL